MSEMTPERVARALDPGACSAASYPRATSGADRDPGRGAGAARRAADTAGGNGGHTVALDLQVLVHAHSQLVASAMFEGDSRTWVIVQLATAELVAYAHAAR